MRSFGGLGVALVTPFNTNGSVDFGGLEKLIHFQIENGTDFLVVQGTTGESATLSDGEKKSVLDFTIEVNANRLPIVLGVGGNNTVSVSKQLEGLKNDGIDGILSVSPYSVSYTHLRAHET